MTTFWKIESRRLRLNIVYLLGVSSGSKSSCCQKRKLLSNCLMRTGGKISDENNNKISFLHNSISCNHVYNSGCLREGEKNTI